MTERSPYSLNDLLLLIGQSTVELAYLRSRVAELEAKQEEAKTDNGVVHASEAQPVA